MTYTRILIKKEKWTTKSLKIKSYGIAKKEGLILDDTKLDTKFYNKLVKAIFEDDNEDHLFALKLHYLN